MTHSYSEVKAFIVLGLKAHFTKYFEDIFVSSAESGGGKPKISILRRRALPCTLYTIQCTVQSPLCGWCLPDLLFNRKSHI